MSSNPDEVTTVPAPRSKVANCLVVGGCGCVSVVFLLVVAGLIGLALYSSSGSGQKLSVERLISGLNVNPTLPDLDDVTKPFTNTNEPITAKVDRVDETTGERFSADGVSLGFPGDNWSDRADVYTYQVGAFADITTDQVDWPALRLTLRNPAILPPFNDAEDYGSLWVGALLDNGYFIQVGLITSEETAADGTMEWKYFWQMWDDQDNYVAGLQSSMSGDGWAPDQDQTFTLTCQNPTDGTWEFWVNDQTVGRANTVDCDFDIANAHVFYEVVTDNPSTGEPLPEFGPFEFKQFEYWDGFEWRPIGSATVSFSYGPLSTGSVIDRDAVCPPYGAESLDNKFGFQAGSSLACPEQGSTLW